MLICDSIKETKCVAKACTFAILTARVVDSTASNYLLILDGSGHGVCAAAANRDWKAALIGTPCADWAAKLSITRLQKSTF